MCLIWSASALQLINRHRRVIKSHCRKVKEVVYCREIIKISRYVRRTRVKSMEMFFFTRTSATTPDRDGDVFVIRTYVYVQEKCLKFYGQKAAGLNEGVRGMRPVERYARTAGRTKDAAAIHSGPEPNCPINCRSGAGRVGAGRKFSIPRTPGPGECLLYRHNGISSPLQLLHIHNTKTCHK